MTARSGLVLKIFLLALASMAVQQPVLAAGGVIPVAANLAESAKMAQQQGLPTIVYVSRDACPYCRTLTDSILGPMYAAGKFRDRAVLIELSLDKVGSLTGFDGQPITAEEFAQQYKAQITPTLLFLDAGGREISKRRIGISNLELYSQYLQRSIDAALTVTRSSAE
jgi:thioredoxin-related protein